MQNLYNYLKLIRIQNQTGTLLLFIPCLLGIVFIKGFDAKDISLFIIACFFARSCGCILNDIADNKIDKKNPTTEARVIANGLISKKKALVFFAILVTTSLPLLFFFSKHIFLPLAISGIITLLYPYSKRFFSIPQILLGLCYASGFIISVTNSVDMPFYFMKQKVFIFYFGLVFWVIFFDTIYSKRDFAFDKSLKINSSSIFFSRHTFASLMAFSVLSILSLFVLYTIWLGLILIPLIPSLFWIALRSKGDEKKINIVLISLIILINILLSVFAKTWQDYTLLAINATIYSIAIFTKPSLGFKLNVLSGIPLTLLFVM